MEHLDTVTLLFPVPTKTREDFTDHQQWRYLGLPALLSKVSEPIRIALMELFSESPNVSLAKGSAYNHQAWKGGFVHHIIETMNIALFLFHSLSQLRPLPFTVEEALEVMLLHDLEKGFPERISKYVDYGMERPRAKDKVRQELLRQTGIINHLSATQRNALENVEGEKDYSNTRRGMGELAAFCHCCDILSARLWHNKGKEGQW